MFSLFKRKKTKKPKKARSAKVRVKGRRLRRKAPKAAKTIVERRPPASSMEQMLLRMRQDLLAGIARSRGQESDVAKVEIGDALDISSQERERDLVLTLSDMERAKLKEIDEALKKIVDKTYGICEECGEKIPPARLKVLPFTRVCVDCKSKLEKEEQMKKALEEEGIPQGIIYPEGEEEET